MTIAPIRINLPQLHNPPRGWALFAAGGGAGLVVARKVDGCFSGEKASQDLVSDRTCIA